MSSGISDQVGSARRSRPLTVWAGSMLAACVVACDATPTRPSLPSELQSRLAKARVEAQSNKSGLVRLGRLQVQGELWFEAAETFLRAKEQGVETAEVYAGLAESYVQLGYVESSVDALRNCFRLVPGQPDCLYAFGKLLERDPSDGAQREVQRTWARFLVSAPADHPKRAYAQSSLAQLNGRFGPLKPEDLAGPAPRPASQPAPDSSEDNRIGELNPYGQAIGNAYRAMSNGDPEGAVKAFETALGIRPDDPPTLAGLAEALLEINKPEEAMAAVDKAWTLDPENAQVRYAFGLVLLKTRQDGRAQEALEAWRALARDTPDYAKRLGVDRMLQLGKPQ